MVAHRRAVGTESAGLSDEGVVERARRAQHLVARAIVGGKEGQCPIEAAGPEVGGGGGVSKLKRIPFFGRAGVG